MMKYQRGFGFTLVELMVVVLILGALAFVAIPRIGESSETAKTSACETNVDLLNSQLELNYAQGNGWPATLGELTGDTDLFPDGAPTCPHETDYVYDDTDHRVTSHTH
ncbi:MAG: prepilin-type N-terminal cleavage/methylation domain-containing protein [Planctomycetes bacterium]|nr:prepilin-type N-terminal cleavage/methylation domain-containing protein [Planctomycetota bacterium]